MQHVHKIVLELLEDTFDGARLAVLPGFQSLMEPHGADAILDVQNRA